MQRPRFSCSEFGGIGAVAALGAAPARSWLSGMEVFPALGAVLAVPVLVVPWLAMAIRTALLAILVVLPVFPDLGADLV